MLEEILFNLLCDSDEKTTQEIAKKAASDQAAFHLKSEQEGWLLGVFPTADFNISLSEQRDNKVSVRVTHPIRQPHSNGLVFGQDSFLHHDGYYTFNTGLGYRKTIRDGSMIIGANVFYDHALDYHHNRMSFGAELLTPAYDLYLNRYMALSNRSNSGHATAETPMSGYDFGISVPLPHNPKVNIHMDHGRWNGDNFGALNLKHETRTRYAIDYQPDAVKYEIGTVQFKNQKNDVYLNVSFDIVSLMKNHSENASLEPNQPAAQQSIRDKMNQAVVRHNVVKAR